MNATPLDNAASIQRFSALIQQEIDAWIIAEQRAYLADVSADIDQCPTPVAPSGFAEMNS